MKHHYPLPKFTCIIQMTVQNVGTIFAAPCTISYKKFIYIISHLEVNSGYTSQTSLSF